LISAKRFAKVSAAITLERTHAGFEELQEVNKDFHTEKFSLTLIGQKPPFFLLNWFHWTEELQRAERRRMFSDQSLH
jgi:hypothetical protein